VSDEPTRRPDPWEPIEGSAHWGAPVKAIPLAVDRAEFLEEFKKSVLAEGQTDQRFHWLVVSAYALACESAPDEIAGLAKISGIARWHLESKCPPELGERSVLVEDACAKDDALQAYAKKLVDG